MSEALQGKQGSEFRGLTPRLYIFLLASIAGRFKFLSTHEPLNSLNDPGSYCII